MITKIFKYWRLIAYLLVNILIIYRLSVSSSDLSVVEGKIVTCRKESSGRSGFAYMLRIENNSTRFIIRDEFSGAFSFLEKNDVLGHVAKIYFNDADFTFGSKEMYHLYKVVIDDNEILKVEEAKENYRQTLLILILGNIVILYFFYRNRTV